jgi:hypothetical protein
VSESPLTSRIKALRQALGDDGKAQRLVRTVRGRGYQFVGQVDERGEHPTVTPTALAPDEPPPQEVRFCTTDDGVRLAYAAMGAGPPLVKVANWLSHLDYDWETVVWRHWLWELSRRHTVALDHAATALETARARGFAHHVAIAQILWGWSRAALGETAEGLDELRAGIEAYGATGARMDLPYFLGLLADALLRAGRIGEGVEAIDEALAETGDRDYCHAAQLHRLRALLMAEHGADNQDVTAELVQARDIARRQGAPLLEERASHALDEIAPAVAQD